MNDELQEQVYYEHMPSHTDVLEKFQSEMILVSHFLCLMLHKTKE
jgi:hypothetical protein